MQMTYIGLQPLNNEHSTYSIYEHNIWMKSVLTNNNQLTW